MLLKPGEEVGDRSRTGLLPGALAGEVSGLALALPGREEGDGDRPAAAARVLFKPGEEAGAGSRAEGVIGANACGAWTDDGLLGELV